MIDPIGILSGRGFFMQVGERANFGLLLMQNRLIAEGITLGASIVKLGIGES
jgi:hypothetical protein